MPQSPTTNMLLVQPSENGDAGTWDTILTALFLLIDAHDHSTGKGVTVKSAGISINADLSIASGGVFYALKDVKTLDFQPSTAASMTSYASNLFVNSSDSNNLYFRTQSGTNVRITNGTSLDITSSGGFGGDYISVAAEAAFSDAGKEYTFKQKDPDNFWAAMRSGPLRIAQLDTTESVYVEVIAPAALGSSYTITLPTAAPAATSVVQMSNSGVLSASASAAIASGAITATGAISSTSTVTGTDFKFTSTVTFNIGGCAATLPSASAPTYTVNDTTGEAIWTFATGNRIALPAGMLRSGDRITAFLCRADSTAGGSGTLDTKLWRKTSTAAPTQIGTTLSHTNTTTDQSQTLGTPEAVDAGDQFQLTVRCTAGTPVFYSVGITIDRP
jgi:hypothetical protein